MGKKLKFDEAEDSDELQALFDSFAAPSGPPAAVAPKPEPEPDGDCDALQALFDSVAAASSSEGAKEPDEASDHSCEVVFNRIGHMTRQLHDTLRELGYDQALEEAAKAIPDARQRLAYVAQMTEQAASRVLNATDVARPLQESLEGDAELLSARWDCLYRNELNPEAFKELAADTRAYLKQVPAHTRATSQQLIEIMMAQDFQDLTGQVIKRVVELAQSMESQLLQVLLESMPQDRKVEAPDGLLNGPVVCAEGRTDVVTDQTQVDELLESLGF